MLLISIRFYVIQGYRPVGTKTSGVISRVICGRKLSVDKEVWIKAIKKKLTKQAYKHGKAYGSGFYLL
jgi:hypothetical protein